MQPMTDPTVKRITDGIRYEINVETTALEFGRELRMKPEFLASRFSAGNETIYKIRSINLIAVFRQRLSGVLYVFRYVIMFKKVKIKPINIKIILQLYYIV